MSSHETYQWAYVDGRYPQFNAWQEAPSAASDACAVVSASGVGVRAMSCEAERGSVCQKRRGEASSCVGKQGSGYSYSR